jgi:hypothetical protein
VLCHIDVLQTQKNMHIANVLRGSWHRQTSTVSLVGICENVKALASECLNVIVQRSSQHLARISASCGGWDAAIQLRDAAKFLGSWQYYCTLRGRW